jgi:hypothetical protein
MKMLSAPVMFCLLLQPPVIQPEPIRHPRFSEIVELFVDRDPEVVELRNRLLTAEEKLDNARRNLRYESDIVVVRAKADVRYIKSVWERRRAKVGLAIQEILQEPSGMDILLKLYGDKKP